MTSLRQIESNRRNALRSTGPKTDTGKQRSAQNAVRHGLTAETVIEPLEDPEDYKAFEQAITADYDAETVVERELVLRLSSLLWRLRRSTLIETGLFQIQSEVLRERRTHPTTQPPSHDCALIAASRIGQFASVVRSQQACGGNENDRRSINGDATANATTKPDLRTSDPQLDLAECFLHLSNLDDGVFERLGRYEMALWRQVRQTLFTLERLRWPPSSARSWRTQRPWTRTIGASPVAESER